MIYSYAKLGRWGALGNQLWEIAGTLGIAKKNNAEVSFPKWEYQNYFNVPGQFFSYAVGDIDLSGDYLQNLKHFSEIEGLIREYFKPSEWVEDYIYTHYEERLKLPDKIGVHVRRANNLLLPNYHPVCSLEYFERALDIIGPGNVFVFSDDMEWCRKQSVFKDAHFGIGNPPGIDVMRLTDGAPLALPTAALDLHLLAKMDAHVISNSTFSWWSAWLTNGRHVVVPKPWYGPALQNIDVKGTMLLPHWIELER